MWLRFGILIGIILFVGCSDETALKESAKKESVKVEKEENYGIPWEKDLATALKKAKQEKKRVMVMAIGQQCRWCIKMKKETMSKPNVLNVLKNHYLLVKIDRGIPSQRSQVPAFEHVPAFFFATAEGKFYDELQGYFTADEFLSSIKEIEELE